MATYCFGLWVLGQAMSAAMGQGPVTSAPDDLAGVNPEWVAPMQQKIDEQFGFLVSAYDLDEASAKALKEELHRRLVAQVPQERAYQHDRMEVARKFRRRREGIDPGGAVGAEERQAFLLKLKSQLEAMPLYEKLVADWVEQRVPAARVPEGRKRLEEFWRRRDRQREAFLTDSQRRSNDKSVMHSGKLAEVAVTTARDQPLPGGPKGPEAKAAAEGRASIATPVQMPGDFAKVPTAPKPPPKIDLVTPRTDARPSGQALSSPPAATSAPAEKSEPDDIAGAELKEQKSEAESDKGKDQQKAIVSQPTAAPAPPLDEWDRHVIGTAQKYNFSEPQVGKARAILGDLRKRAEQYRSSHANDYAMAEMIGEAGARRERLNQLDQAMDALFSELMARVECLASLEQKQKAGAAAPAPGGAGARMQTQPPTPPGRQNPPAAPAKAAEPKKGK